MFDTLTDKFSGVFRSLSGRGKISEENIRESMREVRTALLEADVNYQVVKEFADKVVEKAIGQHVIDSLQPGQLMVKIVYDELQARDVPQEQGSPPAARRGRLAAPGRRRAAPRARRADADAGLHRSEQ